MDLEAEIDRMAAHAEDQEAAIRTWERELQEVSNRLEPARLRMQELESVLRVRMDELTEQHAQLRHMCLDATVKDAYVVRLRDDLIAADLRTTALNVTLDAQRAELDRLRADLDQFHVRLAQQSNRLLHRVPVLHRLVKATLRGGGREQRD